MTDFLSYTHVFDEFEALSPAQRHHGKTYATGLVSASGRHNLCTFIGSEVEAIESEPIDFAVVGHHLADQVFKRYADRSSPPNAAERRLWPRCHPGPGLLFPDRYDYSRLDALMSRVLVRYGTYAGLASDGPRDNRALSHTVSSSAPRPIRATRLMAPLNHRPSSTPFLLHVL